MNARWYGLIVVTFLSISQDAAASELNTKNTKNKPINNNNNGKNQHKMKGNQVKDPNEDKIFLTSEKISKSSEALELIMNDTDLNRIGARRQALPWRIKSTADNFGGEIAKYDALTSETYTAISIEQGAREWDRVRSHWGKISTRLYWEKNILTDARWFFGWTYKGIPYFTEGEKHTIYACYIIGSTYMSAMADLEDYYQIRYLYSSTLEFDMGYTVHEIIRKYTIALELYHVAQYRFWNRSRHENIAPSIWMFYIYTVILEQAYGVVHLCNALTVLEKKYNNPPKTPFYSERIAKKKLKKGKKHQKQKDKEKGVANAEEAMHYYDDTSQERHKRPDNRLELILEIKKKNQKRVNRFKHKLFVQNHIWSTTAKTRRPMTFKNFPHHYGWSIENW